MRCVCGEYSPLTLGPIRYISKNAIGPHADDDQVAHLVLVGTFWQPLCHARPGQRNRNALNAIDERPRLQGDQNDMLVVIEVPCCLGSGAVVVT